MLLFIDGFDTYGATDGAATTFDVVQAKYIAAFTSGMTVEAGRTGSGHSLAIKSSTTRLSRQLTTTDPTVVIGFGVYSSLSALNYLLNLATEGNWGMNLLIQTTGQIVVRRYTTTLGSSATGVITANTWHYLEFKTLINNTTGTYEVWVDGVSVVSGTGVDTQNHASLSYSDYFSFRGIGATGVRIDDLYVLDGTGAVNNTNLGEVEVTTLYPDGDDTVQWTANSGGSHYVEVDEAEFAGDDFIESNTAAQQDIFTYQSMPSNGAIKGVQVCTELRESDAASFQLKTLSKNAVTTVNGTLDHVGTTDFEAKPVMFENDPSVVAWTQATVNSNKFGIEVV